MQLDRNTVATLFEINSPIWNGEVGKRVVGLAKHRLGKHNEIHFMYRRKSDGELSIPDHFYFDGDKASQYKTQNIRGTVLVLVPFSELERLERKPEPKTMVFFDEASTITDEMMDDIAQVSLFSDIETVETAEQTRRNMNAVKWLLAKGDYQPVIGGMKNLADFQLKNKDTGGIEHFNINQVLADYDQDRKDEARMRAAEKRQKAN